MWSNARQNIYSIYGILLFTILALYSVTGADNAVNPATPRTCYSCEGIHCLRITRSNVTTNCTDLLDFCVTVFRGFTVVARGCYTDLAPSYREKCDSADHPECVKCFGERCNDKGRADFKCIECKSSENSQCVSNSDALPAVQCPIPTAQNSYCYVRQTGTGSIARGCLVHQREQLECLSDKQCSMCLSDDAEACNSYKMLTTATGGARRLSNAGIADGLCLTLLAIVAPFISSILGTTF